MGLRPLAGSVIGSLAAGTETGAGVIAKKLVEHVDFCYFQIIQQTRRKESLRE